MPKGRKRRQTRERRRGEGGTATMTPPSQDAVAPRKPRAAENDGPLPSMVARITGLIIAALTLFLAALMVYQSVTGDATGIDGAARIVGGAALILLAIVVGVLSVVPGMVRDWFARRRDARA